MIKVENGCVSCGLPCLGDSCPMRHERTEYCDHCQLNEPEYEKAGVVFCESCAFDYCTIEEMLDYVNSNDLVGIDFYVNYMFETDATECDPDLIELCKRDFKADSEQHLEKLKQFCKDNMDGFLEYCEFSVYTPE